MVAAISIASARDGVVLIGCTLVAFVLVLNCRAGADGAGLAPDVLVRFSADGRVGRTFFEELLHLAFHLWRFPVLRWLIHERIHAAFLSGRLGVALVALESVSKERDRQEDTDDGGNLGDHVFGVEIMRVTE